jgi:GNAT superfamily N-acetyltransferase
VPVNSARSNLSAAAVTGLHVRLALLSDLDQGVKLIRAAYHDARYSRYPIDDMKVRQVCMRAISDRERQAVIVAELSDKIVGYVWGGANEALLSRTILATIHSIYVAPSARNGLAAIKLLHAFRKWAEIKGCREIHLNVTTGVRLAKVDRFIKRLGYRQTGGNYVAELSARSLRT